MKTAALPAELAAETRPLVLFDGVCNLCNGAVNFIIDHDPAGKVAFASLQSGVGQQYLGALDLPLDQFNSFIVVKGGRAFVRSRGALEVARFLKGAWPLLYAFIIVPGFIRNGVYDIISRNRYKWFGQRDACRMPTPELKARFVE